ncbi:MAG: family 43 glycosylhydrolase [Sedimentisphaerales bacterium]|nr:family 43 glycosylhydrolase [Sedimentisphaerales bacterium]
MDKSKTNRTVKIIYLLCLLISLTFSGNAAEEMYLFTSFGGDGDGLHLSYSNDGYNWVDLHEIFLKPAVGNKLMRDPHITQDTDGVFHLVWTTGWHDKGIGYARSKDLVNWSEQKFIPVMADTEGTKNCWAPEMFYDDAAGEYIIFWASDVEGRFPDTVSQDRMNNRTYYVTTKDFKTFSKAELFFDPGFDHIDATIIKFSDSFVVAVKEGDKQKQRVWGPIHLAQAEMVKGPYTLMDKPLVSNQRAEGPTLAKVGDDYIAYFDYYGEGKYGAYKTRDFKTWTDISGEVRVVNGQRHGTVFKVAGTVVDKLKASVDTAKAPAPVLAGFNADPHIAVFGDEYFIYPTSDGHDGWGSTSFSCYSSKDLRYWRSHGVILDLPRDLGWAQKHAWAPAIATKNGKYYFYVSAGKNIGVVVADRPEGPYKDPLGKPLIASGEYNAQMIDPMVFVDEDGKGYIYFGSGKCFVAPLNDDMISLKEKAKDITTPGFREGAFTLKRNGIYYLMWSENDTRDPQYCVAYGTSKSPMGPFVKAENNPVLKGKGIVKAAGHHSVVKVPGRDKYYIAYHRFGIPDGNGYKRETCIGDLDFNPDGTIKPVDVFKEFTPLK